MKISRRRKGQLVVSYQVVTDPCCGLPVIVCGFILHLIGRETINIPEIFSSAHSFTGKTVNRSSSTLSGSLSSLSRGDQDPEKYLKEKENKVRCII